MDNLSTLLELAQPADWVAGIEWYRLANGHARNIAVTAGVTLRQAAACIAVLSPRMSWPENLRVAHLVAQHHGQGDVLGNFAMHTRVTYRNLAKAFAVLQGDLGALHGPKVEAFADNIQFPTSSRRVTIDSWAFRCWAGMIGVCDEVQVRLTPQRCAEVEADYVRLADSQGLLPCELQAILWVTAHRLENKPL